MTTVAQQPISRGRRFWRGLVSHKPLKRHIDWWLRGLAICSVPLIVGCTIIIGAELAAADWFSTGIGLLVANATEDLLNAAIEGSMLGCIALSKQARKAGDTKQAGTMKWMGLLFAALTVVTVGFRVFHVSPDWGLVLLWVRCGAGIAFCCLSHFNDDDDAEEVTPLQHRTQMEQLTETFNQQVKTLKEEIANEREQMKKLVDQQEGRLQQIIQDALSHVRVTEDNQTGTLSALLPPGTLQKAESVPVESGISNQQKAESPEERKAEPTEDKLELMIRFLREHPDRVKDDSLDTELAPMLGLKRPASVRFWRLKAIELLNAEEAQKAVANTDLNAFNRVLAYVENHAPTTQKDIAASLGLSDRCVREHLATIRKNGQMPEAWTKAKSGKEINPSDSEVMQKAESESGTEDNRVRLRVVR